ncbi:MAG: malto-oligosyltrehalose trehalohydrolase [Armatimonadota bacterium]|nr:malto-oligosyltrehalose trehalohydrolase [Armatimonadota bacterium]MDR7534110.1 malto-oligosyltrehalose trehalohydrolase [Armatimonadota bacterium]
MAGACTLPWPGPLRRGAHPVPGGVRFAVWAPAATRVEVILEPDGDAHPLHRRGGWFEGVVAGVAPGALYRYRLDGGSTYPDPASRFQPHGVHGPSEVIEPGAYRWADGGWQGVAQERLVFYELHVGAFSPEGTFAGLRRRLPYLRDLGVTAVELMPVADFPGRWNWGYDGAALFAPAAAYGRPDDLRALVDEAHRLGLAVFLDVVCNHLGPDGAYAPAFDPRFFSRTHRTPWGPAINFDGEGADGVRAFFIDSALHWLAEYHLDGLRLDATHAIVDESPTHFLLELRRAVAALPGPRRYLIAEDHRNLARLVRPAQDGGYELDGVWSDDYHHQVRRLLAGDTDGYFADFAPSWRDLATIVRQGWLFTGQYSSYFGAPRGTSPDGVPLCRFVHFLQNHDQVGNRPQGERLTATVAPAVYRAASALLLLGPALPLLFMGQEWAASTPFCFFTDHAPPLGELVREGRRREFRRFAGFAGAIPDPQDPQTFARSRLDWTEPARAPHRRVLQLYRDLLALRQTTGAAGDPGRGGGAAAHRSRRAHGTPAAECEESATSPADGGLVVRRGRWALVVALRDGLVLPRPPGRWAWDTEQSQYTAAPVPPRVAPECVTFPRAAAGLVEVAP